ncbi:MAG TPA: enoyl-CoA hydratase/isomerase family protein [Candidatus Xenobia bacterium]|nr:enoyl-CoA hydratase/isomerase family protein [Candidatus Xenobia bacterium]
MSGAGHIEVEREGAVARVWLNRPPLNVLDIATLEELGAALDSLPGPPHLCFLVFQGRGERGFSAGVEVRDHTPDRVGQMLSTFHAVFRKLWASDWITVAAVHGNCLGGGMELATFCDFLIATHTARFGQPEIRLGCFPPVAAVTLPALIGPRRALELILTGPTLTAADAQALGLATQVVGENELDSAVTKLIEELQALSPAVLALARKAVLRASGLDFEPALAEMEDLYLGTLMKTRDAMEGIRAFIEKRQPVWAGR